MFEDWKRAWRQAMENFQREVHEGTPGAPPRVRAMERELMSAAGALSKLDDEIRRTRMSADAETREEQVCRRRETLAREVDDTETVQIAAEFAARHAERAALLNRKLSVLEEERALLDRDVQVMRDLIARAAPLADGAAAGSVADGTATRPSSEPDDRDFSRLEREARERAAAEWLEELKRRMNG
jgi:hypothetical protein